MLGRKMLNIRPLCSESELPMCGTKRMMLGFSLAAATACVCGAECTTDWKSNLPRPIFEEHPQLADLYEKAWELAHDHIRVLPGLPSPRYMDEALWDDRVWIWDTCFMVQFCKYLPLEFPGVESLENFYDVMLADKAAPLPRVKCDFASTGQHGEMLDFYIHHPDNPPIFAWTEYKYALQTGDRMRLERIYAKNRWLQRWYDLFESFDPDAPQPHGSICKVALKRVEHGYHWKGCPNGMDNTPRGRTQDCPDADVRECPNNPDLLWVDAIAQQGLSALYLAKIADLIGRSDEAKAWQERYEALKAEVNALYWDEKDGAYYDILSHDFSKVRVLTPASFWPALAGMPTPERMSRMSAHLRNPDTLGGEMPTPSVARNDKAFDPKGGYWRGGVWMPTTYMTVKALDAYGDYALAREVSRKVIERMYRTFANFEPHTIWECYSPNEDKPSTDKIGGWSRPDFCGWSALGPISLFLEDVIGIKEANAFRNTLTCDFEKNPKGRVGVGNYRFGRVVCSVVADAKTIRVTANRPFILIADGARHEVKDGDNLFGR